MLHMRKKWKIQCISQWLRQERSEICNIVNWKNEYLHEPTWFPCTAGFPLLLNYNVNVGCRFHIFVHHSVNSQFVCFLWCFTDLNADQTTKCLVYHNRCWCEEWVLGLSFPVIYYWPLQWDASVEAHHYVCLFWPGFYVYLRRFVALFDVSFVATLPRKNCSPGSPRVCCHFFMLLFMYGHVYPSAVWCRFLWFLLLSHLISWVGNAIWFYQFLISTLSCVTLLCIVR